MYKCADCGSTNIVDCEVYQAYFREGEWIRLRSIMVHENINGEPRGWIASCPEKSFTATAIGSTELEAIKNLGDILEGMQLGKLLGSQME